MDAASILVSALCAGVAALLVWFEVNSRRNDAKRKTLTPAPDAPSVQKKQDETAHEERHKAA